MEIEFPEEGITIDLEVTQITEDQYQIDNIPFMVETVGFRDIIETEKVNKGLLRFKRIVKKTDWNVYDVLLPKKVIESKQIQSICDHVAGIGGYSERIAGGCLFICVPPDIKFNPANEINKLFHS